MVNTRQRRYANLNDTQKICPICNKSFRVRQRIFFSLQQKPVHVYRCRRGYYAAIAVYYKLNAEKLVSRLSISPRTAARIIAEAREIAV